jgi:hypothetical protein
VSYYCVRHAGSYNQVEGDEASGGGGGGIDVGAGKDVAVLVGEVGGGLGG